MNKFQADDWPFADPQNVAVFTRKQVMRHGQPIVYVTHDEEDGAWQFHSDGDCSDEDAMIVALSSVLRLDPTIAELADLPFGWTAWRPNADAPWQRAHYEEQP